MNPRVEKVRAVSDDGYETTLIVRPSIVPVELRDDPDPNAPGALEACTIDGYSCEHLGGHKFKIVGHPAREGLVVRRADAAERSPDRSNRQAPVAPPTDWPPSAAAWRQAMDRR
jgi:hypothetical protein